MILMVVALRRSVCRSIFVVADRTTTVTLDPIHVETIARLAERIADDTDDTDHDDLAMTIFEEWLDPLVEEGIRVVEPLESQTLKRVRIDDVALADSPYGTVCGLDSGTINPTTFKNGLVLDVAHAAMAADPSDIELHRSRTVIAAVHTSDHRDGRDHDWIEYDEGYSRKRVLSVPRVNRFAEGIVHALSLYLAESEHALEHESAVEELLVLDGPLYPKELLSWEDREAELQAIARDAKPRSVLENYLELVERFVGSDRALVGFVKNPTARTITGALADAELPVPWADDTAFFTRLLDPGPRAADGRRRRDVLTFTSWFVSRGGPDGTVSDVGDALGLDRELDPEAYTVTFFVVYDPRSDLCYKIEAPRAITDDPETRAAITRQVLAEIAAHEGPPIAVAKADELARISAAEKASLRRRFEEKLDSDRLRSYDGQRWGEYETDW